MSRCGGRVAGSFAGVIALFIAVPANADSGGVGGNVPPDPITQPGQQAVPPSGGSGAGGGGSRGSIPPGAPTGRPVLTVFNVSPAAVAASSSGTVVRFQVRDRARRVRVRLAFVNLADRTTHRVNLGGRRTGVVHSYSWTRKVAAGAYRVRITARNPRGKKAVRSTTMQVTRAAARAGDGGRAPLPGRGSLLAMEAQAAASAPQRNGHIHQGQDMAAADGTPLLAVATGTIVWRAYQSGGAGHYLVLDADGEAYNYVYMHIQSGSMLVGKGDRVTVGQHIANVGNTGGSEGPHLHFEVWDGPWYSGGHPVDPLPFLKSWE